MKTLLALVALTSIAGADSFEAKADAAKRIRLDDLVWALTASCERTDDAQARQCRIVRDRKAKELAGATLIVEGAPGAVELGTWDAAKKSVSVKLVGCIACDGLELDGKRWHVIDTKGRVDGGTLRGGVLYDTAKVLPDQAAAEAWRKPFAQQLVDYVVKLPARPRAQLGGKDVIQLEVVAFRVVGCDGTVLAADPPAQATPPRRCK